MLAELLEHLVVHLGPSVEHGHEEAFHSEVRVWSALHQADGLEELAEAFEGEELRLYRDDHGVSCREAVDCDQTEGRGAVYYDVVISVPDLCKGIFEECLSVGVFHQLDLGAHEVDV